jgi:putative tryptophan/tyrosine transport system substrate-binding protein
MGRVGRRQFLAAGGALLIAPPEVHAQSRPSAQIKTVAVLASGSAQDAERSYLSAFRSALKTQGWVEKGNLVIDVFPANRKVEQLPALAESLVRRHPDAIFAVDALAALAAARATKIIPIVFRGAPWPVESGLVDSFAHPGRNVTGVSYYAGIEVSTKRLQALKEIAPTATRLSWILDANSEATVSGARLDIRPLLDPAVRSLGYEVRYHYVRTDADVDPALAEILAWRPQALSVAGSPITFVACERIVAFAQRNGLPSAAAFREFVDAGGLLCYTPTDLAASIARCAEYVARVLSGAKPAELPVEQPSRYELVINVKTAKALGLKIPQHVLAQADQLLD